MIIVAFFWAIFALPLFLAFVAGSVVISHRSLRVTAASVPTRFVCVEEDLHADPTSGWERFRFETAAPQAASRTQPSLPQWVWDMIRGGAKDSRPDLPRLAYITPSEAQALAQELRKQPRGPAGPEVRVETGGNPTRPARPIPTPATEVRVTPPRPTRAMGSYAPRWRALAAYEGRWPT